MTDSARQSERRQMVEDQIIRRGISDARVLEAFRNVPRHRFVPEIEMNSAYSDHPLSIGHGQTISQPYMVACMTELLALEWNDRVLEIGTGSGYQTAILAYLAGEIFSVERIAALSRQAGLSLASTGFKQNIHLHCGDGTKGWAEHAPYNAIIVTAGAPVVPQSLKQQLADGGRLVIPVGNRQLQTILAITRRGDFFNETKHTTCVFVPLIGEEGW